MVPTLSERLRRRAYDCYSPRHILVPWQVSPELPTALICLAAAGLAAEPAVQISAGAAVQPMPLAQRNRPLTQISQPQPNQPQPISPRQIQDLSELAGTGAVSASKETAGQHISQELVLLLVLSLLTLLDGAKTLRQLLTSTALIWRPRPAHWAALPVHCAGPGAKRTQPPDVGGSFQRGVEGIQQRPFAQLAGTGLLSPRRRN